MSAFNPIRCLFLHSFAVVCLTIIGCSSQPTATQEQKQPGQVPPAQSKPSPNDQMPSQHVEDQQGQDEEVQMGQEVFNQLKAKGEIIESSPLYEQLRPISDAIAKAAQPQYEHPFKFYLVHEAQPNAFATPGGNVYVVDSLLYFVKNKEQLAGTLCHEVSHTIHRDSIALMKK